jgi:aspartate/methionine/tyrosine aminotransferase
MCAEYAHRRDMLDRALGSAEGLSWRKPRARSTPSSSTQADMPARDFTQFLLERGIAVRSGTEFGPAGEGFIRLSFATSRENIEEGARRLATAAAEAQRLTGRPLPTLAPRAAGFAGGSPARARARSARRTRASAG